ncbi:MAG: nucleotidyltransferase family protein [Clostridia bacterium]|nr:nucleotidyltransferase family protein [Clostridia bacterium]
MKYGNLVTLDQFADILYRQPKEYVTMLSHELEKGLSYPKARENALLLYLNDVRKYSSILSYPNNILAIEYLKAIKKLKSNILPVTIKRIGADYNSLEANGKFASATAIRNFVKKEENIENLVPSYSYEVLKNNIKYSKVIYGLSSLEKEIIYKLRTMSISQIRELQDVSEGLENLIKKAANSCNNLEDLINIIKSKRYTQSRIQRILIYALLDITKKDIKESYRVKPYIRILGISNHGKKLLSEMNNKDFKYSVITSVKKFIEGNKNKTLENILLKDMLASNIYTLGYEFDSKANLDYTNKLIIE